MHIFLYDSCCTLHKQSSGFFSLFFDFTFHGEILFAASVALEKRKHKIGKIVKAKIKTRREKAKARPMSITSWHWKRHVMCIVVGCESRELIMYSVLITWGARDNERRVVLVFSLFFLVRNFDESLSGVGGRRRSSGMINYRDYIFWLLLPSQQLCSCQRLSFFLFWHIEHR